MDRVPSRYGKRWTNDEKERLRRMYNSGLSEEKMATALSRDVAGVDIQLIRLGLISQADLDQRAVAAQRKYRQEMRQLRKMFKAKCPVDEMAAALSVPAATILRYLANLNLISATAYKRRLKDLQAREAEARQAEIRQGQRHPTVHRPIPIHGDPDELFGYWAEGEYVSWDDLGEDDESRFATSAQRKRILKSPCVYCGATPTVVDHVLPHSRGGANNEGNFVPACARCNNSLKGDLTPLEAGMPFQYLPEWINPNDLKGLAKVARAHSARR